MVALYCRIYQFVFRLVSTVLPFRKPEIIKSSIELPGVAKRIGLKHLLIITDSVISSLGLMDEMMKAFEGQGVKWTLYDKTVPNPAIDNIEEALQIYIKNQCDGLVAFGGGSSIDCAKGVSARVARPHKTIPQMKGVLKVLRHTPVLFAVPTTSGTGSEATLAAVITNSQTHEKYAINDTVLIPSYAVLDPKLTLGYLRKLRWTGDNKRIRCVSLHESSRPCGRTELYSHNRCDGFRSGTRRTLGDDSGCRRRSCL